MGDITMRSGGDAWTAQDQPGANFGYSDREVVRLSSTDSNFTYIHFNNPAPRGSTVTSALLKLYVRGSFASTSIRCRLLAAPWSRSTLTFNNAPDATGDGPTITRAGVDGDEWAFDVTTLIQQVTDGAANWGFRLGSTVSDNVIARFYSLTAGENQPVMEVAWSEAPDAPNTLSPSGDRAVSVASPVLRFDYTDPAGHDALQSVQVQINPTNSFTAPAFDSGTVATTNPELDLSATSYAGLAVGSSTWWRVRVQDAAGLWSDWSDASQFQRVAKGTLAISSPTAGGTVSDVTPPIIWSLTGVTQAQWRVKVALASDLTHALYDTWNRAGADTSFTLPKGVISDVSATYHVWVYTRDTVDREATPGDPAWNTAEEDFTFAESATVAPVTGLTAAQVQSGRPWVQLDFSRSSAPDSFTVIRDGHTVDSGLDPADLLVSGTAYSYTDRQAAPYAQHTWKVQAVVNGVTSSGNPTVTFEYQIHDVWLIDPTTDRTCPIVVTGGATFDMPETSATFNPVGSDAAVRVVQSQRGLQGTISGRIIDRAGSPASYWTSNLLIFKRRPTSEVRLILGAQNLRVLVGNIKITPLEAGNPDDRAVSVDFWSLDGPQ